MGKSENDITKTIEESDFLKTFSSSFYKKVLNESLVSYKKKISKIEAKKSIIEAYRNLISYNYNVSTPQEYIYLTKNKYVARIIPVFTIQDEAIYFYLCKQIEDDISKNRVDGTFGGWRIGNSIKVLEDEELEYVINSYDPSLWLKNWKDFQKYIYTNLEMYNYKYALKIDIANFYDSIDINLLSRKLYRSCKKEKYEVVELIIYLLKYWNKKYNNYNENNVGIPQNEFGDQSRLLANLYLNDYDISMEKICDDNDCKYSRFADDQIILFNEDEEINNIMLVCNEELRKLGLNLNVGKVIKFTHDEIIDFYLFKQLEKLDLKLYDEAVTEFFSLVDSNKKVRSDTFLRRCLTIGLDKFSEFNRNRIVSIITKEDFIINCGFQHLSAIYKNLDKEDKIKFLENLFDLYKKIKFNGFRYVVITFAKKNNLKEFFNICINNL